MQPTGLYRFSSVARPVDPAYPTNRAVLRLLPGIAVLGVVASILGLSGATPLGAAVAVTLSAFGGWALTREIAPDDNPAAFVAMVFAVGAQLAFGPVSVIPLFVALLLARIVNRSTGLLPRVLETPLLAGFVMWAMVRLEDPMIGIAAALAFFLDASLAQPARWQLATGFACFLGSLYFVFQDGVAMPVLAGFRGSALIAVTAIVLGYFLVLILTRDLLAVGDVSGEPLDPARVRSGMFIVGFLAVTAPVYAGDPGFNPLLMACLAGVAVSHGLAMTRDALMGDPSA
ncbi:MAG: hypothetical protein JJ992_04355 [Planctomycetes bacterium]|nr:hypothetical protein [Planctomycetota bacterium]